MKKLLIAILLVLLLILVLLIAGGVYLYVSFKPFALDGELKGNQSAEQAAQDATQDYADKNPLLTEQQEKTLENFGIDPAKLPTQITPEMEACFVTKLGDERVREIKGGSEPTAVDFFRAQSCLTK